MARLLRLEIFLAMYLGTAVIQTNAQNDMNVAKKSKRFVNIAILTTPSEDVTELNKAIIKCEKHVNKEWALRQLNKDENIIQISVIKITVKSGNLFNEGDVNNFYLKRSFCLDINLSVNVRLLNDTKILKKKELLAAAFIIEAYAVDPFSCVFSDLLGVPQITLTDEHNPSCKNVLSMRPDTAQLYNSTLAMIRRSQSRIVAVIIENSMGETAIKFMSQGKLAQRFPFQVVGKVNFKKPSTIVKTIRKLKDSGIKRVLMMMHSRHVPAILDEVTRQKLLLDDYKWFLPLMEFSYGLVDMQRMMGVAGMRIPIRQPSSDTNGECNYPALYDAFNLVINASLSFENIIQYLDIKGSKENKVDSNFCPTKESYDFGQDLLKVAKKISFQGRTGHIKFLNTGYRNVTELEAIEIKEKGNIEKLGFWSTKCHKMIWDSQAKDDRELVQSGCKVKIASTGPLSEYQPRNRQLSVVTSEGPPFIFYDPSKSSEGNGAFKGFCKDLLDQLSKHLNFTYKLYIVTPGNYGGTSSNGTSNGMIRDLIKKSADIAIGSLTITAEREKAIDFTKPFMDFTMSLIMKKPPKADVNLFVFLQPFQPELWLSVVAVIFLSGLALYILDRYSPAGFRATAKTAGEGTGEEFNLRNCIWFMTASMLQQGPDYTPRGAGGRILSASFWFFCIIIVSTYTASLAAFFTKKSMETSIKSLEDLAKQDQIAYGVLDGGQTQSFFKNSKLPLYRKMYGQMESKKTFATSTSSAIKKVRHGGYAYLTEHPMLSYHNQQSPCDTVLLKNLLEAKSYGLGLRIDSEWTNPLSVQILKLREKGTVEEMRKKWWDDKSACPTTKTNTAANSAQTLEFMSIAGVYIILACGALLALIMLFIEVKYPTLFTKKCAETFKRKKQTNYDTNGMYSSNNHKSYLDTVDSGYVKGGTYPMEDDYNHSNAKDFDYATKKYFDSLPSNRHYRD